MDKVKYLPHPCSTEVKKEWNAKGCRVLDERFNPESVEQAKSKSKTKKSR